MSTTTRPTARDGFVRGGPQKGLPAGRLLFIVAGLGLVALAILVQFGESGIFSLWDLKAREAELSAEVTGLETANAELANQLEALDKDPAVLERIAREEHNMRREDEEVLLVLPAPSEQQ